MGSLSSVAPNFDKIEKESGQNTSSAMFTLWAAFNAIAQTEQGHALIASSELFSNPLTVAAGASVDNLDMRGFGTLLFSSGTQNFTGIVAPETGRTKVVFVKQYGAGTITAKHNVTSLAANRLFLSGAADFAMTTGKGLVLVYINSLWQEVARSA